MVVNNKKKGERQVKADLQNCGSDTHSSGVAKNCPEKPKNLQGKKSKRRNYDNAIVCNLT
jgi:hypothetical protein